MMKKETNVLMVLFDLRYDLLYNILLICILSFEVRGLAEKDKSTTKTVGKQTKGKPVKKAAKPRQTTKMQAHVTYFGDSILDEVILILLIVISAVILFSLLTSHMGVVGEMLRGVFLGLFGFGGIFVPLGVMGYCVWLLVAKKTDGAILKVSGGILAVLTISVAAYLFHPMKITENMSFFQKAATLYQNGGVKGGGLLGGLLGGGLYQMLGGLGSTIVIVALVVIALILITGHSFFQAMGTFAVYEKNKHEKRKERVAELREATKTQKKTIKKSEKKQIEEKRKRFNIELEGQQKPQEILEIQETVFRKTKQNYPVKQKEPIYDYVKEIKQEEPKRDFRVVVGGKILEELEQEQQKKEQHTAEQIAYPEKEQPENDINTHNINQMTPEQPHQFPPMDLLGKDNGNVLSTNKAEMIENAKKLENTLQSFGVDAKVLQINKGPTVTRYEISPSQGVKVSKIVNLADDIALNLAASGIRIEAPIPGKAAVGIEVPNKETQPVYLRSVLESKAFQKHSSKLAFALGQDIAGNPVVTDIAKMPHLLIAGATGSGKSVCINTLITSILYKADPKEVKLLLVDPKVVELSVYNGIPHLLIPVVTDPQKASSALHWAVREMLKRYNDFAACGVRDIKGFNDMKQEQGKPDEKMPQIVIVIDELADLMMAAASEVEDAICRLAQMARAAGMYLIIATQRPSVDVITGVIKANIPSRLAFAVSSGTDSRTILDMVGAEKLLGKGDMLFYPTGQSKPARMQGAFVTDKEVENIVAFLKENACQTYTEEMVEQITTTTKSSTSDSVDYDAFYTQAVAFVIEKQKASTSMLQRQFRIGYNRAARLMDTLEENGIVGPSDGSKQRKVLCTQNEVAQMQSPSVQTDNMK